MIKNMFRDSGDSHEFKPILAEIETRPLNPLGRFIFWVLILTLLFFTIWLYAGKIDIVVSARGKVVPDGEIKIIQTLDTGVLSKINVKPGDHVVKGDVLVEIDPSTTEPALDSAVKKMNHMTVETERLKALLNNQPFHPDSTKYGKEIAVIQSEIYRSTMDAFNKLISSKQSEISKIDSQYGSLMTEKAKNEELLQYSRETVKRLEKVKDIVAVDSYENARKDVVQYEKNLESIVFKIDELRHDRLQKIDEISYEKNNFRNTNLKELADKERQLNETQAEIDQVGFRNRKQKIEAPISGFINELNVHTIGGVVTPAQNLLSIVPDNTSLVVESVVMNKDVGFVKTKMPVSIKIDTFNFQKYGMVEGEVVQISRDSITDKELGQIYKMIVKPNKLWLMVEGKKTDITSGMTLTSEVNVGKRRIIEFFIYPLIKYLDEGMSVL